MSLTQASLLPSVTKCPVFVVMGAPRTKKTSSRIARFGRNREHMKVIPSAAHEFWFSLAMQQAPVIRQQLLRAGIHLPISEPVQVRALFYRETRTGDLTGFMQAVGDFLQESRQRNGKTVRTGAGIIRDDNQICSWDGSRRLLDKFRPRIEVEIRIIPGGQIEMPLESET